MAKQCRMCGFENLPTDNEEALRVATCRRCNTVMDLRDDATARAPVPLPAGFVVESPEPAHGQGFREAASPEKPVTVRWAWRDVEGMGMIIVLVFCVVVFNGGTVAMLVVFLVARIWAIMLLAPIHLVGGYLAGKMVAGKVLNHTTIRVDDRTLSIEVAPLPEVPTRSIEVADIDQLFCLGPPEADQRIPYQLLARMRDGTVVVLVSDLHTPQQALYLESLLERRMRIEDRPVAGELPGGRGVRWRRRGSE